MTPVEVRQCRQPSPHLPAVVATGDPSPVRLHPVHERGTALRRATHGGAVRASPARRNAERVEHVPGVLPRRFARWLSVRARPDEPLFSQVTGGGTCRDHVAAVDRSSVCSPRSLGAGRLSALSWLLGFLGTAVALPFFAVSTTAPLLQRWFSTTDHPAGKDPISSIRRAMLVAS